MKQLLQNKWISNALTVGMLSLVAICIGRPDEILILRKIAQFSLHIMILLLAAGIGFLLFDQRRLLFTAFGSCALLCLVFKVKADASIRPILRTNEPIMTIAHSYTSVLADNWEEVYKTLDRLNADVITFLEVTPAWQVVLDEYFASEYTNHTSLVRIDDLGAAVYSMFPIASVDTLMYQDNPSLLVAIKMSPQENCQILVSNTNPPLFRQSFIDLREQLSTITTRIEERQADPLLVVGNFHLDQFADELQDFRAQASLSDSRKTMTPSLSPPTNHIFYNRRLDFLQFSNIYSRNSQRIGITGQYQIVQP